MDTNNTPATSQHPVRFHGKSGEYFAIWLVNALLTVITLGIYSAWATVRRRRRIQLRSATLSRQS